MTLTPYTKRTLRHGHLVSTVQLSPRRFETQVFALIDGEPDFTHVCEECVGLTLTEARHQHGTILYRLRRAHEQGIAPYGDKAA